jgi:hypothetical protein
MKSLYMYQRVNHITPTHFMNIPYGPKRHHLEQTALNGFSCRFLFPCQPVFAWWVLKIGMLWHHRWCSKLRSQAQRVNMWPGSHVLTGDALMWLESHLCDQRRTYATGVAYWWHHLWLELQIRDWRRNIRLETQSCDCSSCKFTRGHAHQNSIYSRPFGSDFSFPSHVLLYFYASNQATRYIVTHTRDSNSQHHQRNNHTISLGWYHNSEKAEKSNQ